MRTFGWLAISTLYGQMVLQVHGFVWEESNNQLRPFQGIHRIGVYISTRKQQNASSLNALNSNTKSYAKWARKPTNMLKLRIPGKYWDSHLTTWYEGTGTLELVLIGTDGSIIHVPWEKLLQSLPVPAELRPLMEQALSPSGFHHMTFPVQHFQGWVEANLAEIENHLKDVSLDTNLFAKDPNLFPFPHADVDFGATTFIGTSSGLYQATGCSPWGGPPVIKLSDVPTLAFTRSRGGEVFFAAGDEGLYKLEYTATHVERVVRASDVQQVSTRPCNECVGSLSTSLVVASTNGKDVFVTDNGKYERNPFEGKEGAFHWAAGTTGMALYSYDKERVQTLCLKTDDTFRNLGERLVPWFEDYKFVSAQAGNFGSVIELEDQVLVLRGEGQLLKFPGEVTRVRLYEGQLHLIYADHIEIVFFPHLPTQSLGFGRLPLLSPIDETVLRLSGV